MYQWEKYDSSAKHRVKKKQTLTSLMMAQCKQTPQEFIKSAFTPQVAVLTTPLAEKCCQKNNLNFIELLQPFSRLGNDVHFKDPTGAPITVKNLKVNLLDVNSRPPQTTLARKFLNSSVSDSVDFRTERFVSGEYQLNITTTTPWFEHWRDTFLRVQYPSDHEYTKHFLGCILVVSSAEINVVESVIHLAQSLNQMQGTSPGKLPKWFSGSILKYYVIIHDNVEGNSDAANESFELVKSSYGESNCFLLKINSRPLAPLNIEHLPDPWSQFIIKNIELKDYNTTPESSPYTTRSNEDNDKTDLKYHPLSPDIEELNTNLNEIKSEAPAVKPVVHGICLSTEDIEHVKLFLYDFCKSCLMPYIEKQIQLLSDGISNKKGVSRSLFTATKRWFNPNKPGTGSVTVNNLIYAPDSPELQVRRLGDLYFMFGHYTLAFQAYHLAKRDYNIDQAWLYYAGALEMAALAAYMANESNRKTYDYMEESIVTYLNTCKMPQFAARATLLSSECLKSKGLYGDAAHQLIRMTSEDSDLRSALFLEQAAYCFLHSKMIRKYAFHMVLAGHRFSKAAQRKHSLRSYKQAHEIYANTGWNLAEDHIHYTIGRQAHNLHSFDEAVVSFARLLNGDSKQSGQQQGVFLKEYLTILGNKISKDGDSDIPVLALPKLDNDLLKLLMEPTPPLSTPGKVSAVGISFLDDGSDSSVWNKLEEMLVQSANGGTLPFSFKPEVNLYTIHNLSKNNPTAIVNEPIQVCLTMSNPLQVILQMKDLYLLWSFKNGGDVISNEDSSQSYVKTHLNKSVSIPSNGTSDIILSLTPLQTGIITVKGICYTLSSSTVPTDNIFIKGKQFISVNIPQPKNKKANNAAENKLIDIQVVPLAPCLQVTFSDIHSEFLCDEVQKVTIDFQNTGTLPIHKIFMATSTPQFLCNCDYEVNKEIVLGANKEKLIRENHITCVLLVGEKLDPGHGISTKMYIKAPNKPGPCTIDLLIYYENSGNVTPRYRLVRHKWNLSIQESIKIEASIHQSYKPSEVEEIAIVLKASNLNKLYNSTPTEIRILNVGMLSKLWCFTDSIIRPKLVNLRSQESAHILLKSKRSSKSQIQQSSIHLTSKKTLNYSHTAFARKLDQPGETTDGVIFVQWQACVNDPQKRTVDGQTHFPMRVRQSEDSTDVDDFSDMATLLEASLLQRGTPDRVRCSCLHAAVVHHDFTAQKSCAVPVTLLVHNIAEEAVSVMVNMLAPATGTRASAAFAWAGVGAARRELAALETEPVELCALVSRAGTFDLGARLEVYCGAERQNCEVNAMLIVMERADD